MIRALHGNVGIPADWDFMKPEFEFHAHCLWDRVQDFGPWARQFCDSTRVQDSAPVLLGYSLGGRLALHALLEAPDLWRAAILVSAHTGLATPEEKSARREADAAWAQIFRERPWDEAVERWNRQPILAGGGNSEGRAALKPHRDAIANSFECWSLGRQENLLPRLRALRMPILWITGERDGKFDAIARAAVDQLPNAARHILPNCGHRAPWQDPAAFVRSIKDFLSRQNLLV